MVVVWDWTVWCGPRLAKEEGCGGVHSVKLKTPTAQRVIHRSASSEKH
ncbi:hypothetical protein PpBr36_07266 [Pyricularia pennisetigena]|nr:hypothetical protein PpBr36_07266 [Pyricularia pennisetigena]TLS25306.1 hypothetical protein PpBr36_07266 [Pyricularia pennisetigena]